MSKTTLAWLAIALTTMFWATSLIFAKIVFDEVTPIIFVALRYTLACPFLIVFMAVLGNKGRPRASFRANWRVILATGLTGPFLSQILQYIGLDLTTAGDAILLLNLSPVFAVIIAAPVLNEAITTEKVGGLVLATLGAIMIVMNTTPGDPSFAPLRLLGNMIVIASTFFFALNGIIGKIGVGSMDSLSFTFYSTLSAVPFLWITAAILEDITVLLHLSPTAWLLILWVGVVNTAIGFALYYESLNHIEASKVQIALNLIAVWGVMMSVFILGESATVLQLLGGSLTVIGVVFAQRVRGQSKNEDAKPSLDFGETP
ncbi:MAG: DMT family transporter [Candidatus Thorarchaeota archaeon]|jgi:drug/metabolite transporter (DMT)-like permease